MVFNRKRIIKDVTSNKGILLYEERGVACNRDYLNTIKDIVDYIAIKIKKEKPTMTEQGRRWNFIIPKVYSDKFDIFKTLTINTTVIDNGERANYYSGSGGITTFKIPSIKPVIKNGVKIDRFTDNMIINLTGSSNGNNLCKNSISLNLVHELNHAIDQYKRHFNTNTEGNVFSQTLAYHRFGEKYGTNNMYYSIIYRLFTESELNALISSVYGDLMSINSERENFKYDIKRTQAYYLYNQLESYIYNCESENNRDIWLELYYFFTNYNIISPTPKKTKPNLKYFKKAFINKAKKELNNLIKGIGRVASYYYDNQEETINEIITF